MYDSGKPEANLNSCGHHYTALPVRGQAIVCEPGHLFGLREEAIVVRCRECGTSFGVCRSCWRGQGYCGPGCQEAGQRRLHRQAQRRYRQTEKGKAAHRQAERRRRRIQDPVGDGLPTVAKPVGRAPAPPRPKPQGSHQPQSGKTMADASSSLPARGCKVAGWIPISPRLWAEKGCESWVRCRFCGRKGLVVGQFQRRGYFRKPNGGVVERWQP